MKKVLKSLFLLPVMSLLLVLFACTDTNGSDKTKNTIPTLTRIYVEGTSSMQKSSTPETEVFKIENDIEDLISIEVENTNETNYYLSSNEGFRMVIELENPNDYAIQSLILNGILYTAGMFGNDSNGEKIVLDLISPTDSGYYEYTIDSIIYLDGNITKEALLTTNKTVNIGIMYEEEPMATISNQVISARSIVFDVTLIDELGLIGNNAKKIFLSDGKEIIQTKDLEVGTNHIEFENLQINTSYQYAVMTAYDLVDGQKNKSRTLIKEIFTTLNAFVLKDANVTQTDISFIIEKYCDSGYISSISLYDQEDNNRLVASLEDLSQREFKNLLSDHKYVIIVEFEYEVDGAKISSSYTYQFTTNAKQVPIVEFVDLTTTTNSINFGINIVDDGCLTSFDDIRLYKDSRLVSYKAMEEENEFNNLLSNTEYTLKLTYFYDLNDGRGIQTQTLTKSVITESKRTPMVDVLLDISLDVISGSIVIDSEVVVQIKSIDLYLDGKVIMQANTPEFSFRIQPDKNYSLVIAYAYNLDDGYGYVEKVLEKDIISQKLEPTIDFTDIAASLNGVEFGLLIEDRNNAGMITSIELYKDDVLVFESSEYINEIKNLDKNTRYKLIVTYTYDLNDGLGCRDLKLEKEFLTLKERPLVDITAVTTKDSLTVLPNIIDPDNAGSIYKVELYRGDELIETSGNKLEFTNLLSNNWYTVRFYYQYDINNGEKVMIDEIRIMTKSYTTPDVCLIVSATQTSLSFIVEVLDTDFIYVFSKVEVYNDSELIFSSNNLNTTILENLKSNNNYRVIVYYSYNLNDGNGEIYSTVTKEIRTVERKIPTVSFENVQYVDSNIEFALAILDEDSTITNIKVLLYFNNSLIEIITDLTINSFMNVKSASIYQVELFWEYNLNDGNGAIENRVEETIITDAPVHTEMIIKDMNGNVRDMYIPGETFVVYFYSEWGERGKHVNSLTLDINFDGTDYKDKLEDITNEDIFRRIGSVNDELAGTAKYKELYYNDNTNVDFFDTPGYIMMDSQYPKTVRGLGGMTTLPAAIYNLDMSNLRLMGIIEYTIAEDAEGKIVFDSSNIKPKGKYQISPGSDSEILLAEEQVNDVAEKIVQIVTPDPGVIEDLELSTIGSAISNTVDLNPNYTSERTDYTIDIMDDATYLNIMATFKKNPGLSVLINGVSVDSLENATIDLATIVSGDIIEVIATYFNGSYTISYKIKVNKISTDATLESVMAKAYEDGIYTRNVSVIETGTNYETEAYEYAENMAGLVFITTSSKAIIAIDGIVITSGSEYKEIIFSGAETSKTVTVVVTAEAGNSKTYTVVVKRKEADNNTNVSELEFEGQYEFETGFETYIPIISGDKYTIGTVSDPVLFLEKKITVRIKLEAETSYITYDGKEITSDSNGYCEFELNLIGTDAKYRFEFTVTPQSGEDNNRVYVIEVNREIPATNTSLTYKGYGGTTNELFTPSLSGTTNITYTVALEEDFLRLVLADIDNKTVYVSKNQNSFTELYNGVSYNIKVGETAYVKVVAQDEITSTIYTFIVNANDDYNKDNTLYGLEILASSASGNLDLAVDFSQDKYDGYVFTVDYKYTRVLFTLTINEKATYTISNNGVLTLANQNEISLQNLRVGTNEFRIRVISEAGIPSADEYTIIINRSADNTDNYLESFVVDGVAVNVNKVDKVYEVVLPHGRDNISLEYTTSPRAEATFTPNQTSNIKLDNGKTTIYVTVRSATELVNGGFGRTYTFNIYSASQEKGVTSVELLENEGGVALPGVDGKYLAFDEDTTEYEITVPYVNSTVYLDVEKFDRYATLVTLEGSVGTITLTPGVAKTIQFMVRSEYGQIKGSDDGTTTKVYTVTITRALGSDEAYLNDLQFIVNGENKLLNFEGGLEPLTTDYIISEQLSVEVTTVDIDYLPGKGTVSGDFGKNKPIENAGTFYIYVVAESGRLVTYTITYSKEGYNPSDDTSITSISVVDSDNKEYITSFNPAQTDYNVVLPYDKNSVTITVTLPDGSRATVSIANFVQADKTAQITGITETESVVPIVVRSEDGSSKAIYNVIVSKEVPSSEKDLLAIIIGEERFDNPQPGAANKIEIYIPFSISSLDIAAILPDGSTAQIISGAPETLENIRVGNTIHTIIVQAQDKSINEYYIEIIRDTEDFVYDIEIYDNTNKTYLDLSPKFTADVNKYTAQAVANTVSVSFKITMPNIPGLTYTISPMPQSGVYVLNEGTNEFVITFTSGTGITSEYIITINKPTIDSDTNQLMLDGENINIMTDFEMLYIKESITYLLQTSKTLVTNKEQD